MWSITQNQLSTYSKSNVTNDVTCVEWNKQEPRRFHVSGTNNQSTIHQIITDFPNQNSIYK